jgi:hypothetical protein
LASLAVLDADLVTNLDLPKAHAKRRGEPASKGLLRLAIGGVQAAIRQRVPSLDKVVAGTEGA